MRMRTALEKGDLSEVVAIYQRVQVENTQNVIVLCSFVRAFFYPFASQVGVPIAFCLRSLTAVAK